MLFAQKLHSIEEMEKNRIAFYKRFEEAKMKRREYPGHCVGCWNEEKCQQKVYMLANTESVPGFVGYADVWCEEHKPDNGDTESAGYYPESDTPMHCAECGQPLQCSLTDYGVNYVKETLESGEGCCREVWPVLFAEYF